MYEEFYRVYPQIVAVKKLDEKIEKGQKVSHLSNPL